MKELIIKNLHDIPANFVDRGENNFYTKAVIPWEDVDTCSAAFVEVPVGMHAYSYHWHEVAEEIFYIISGKGRLRCHEGEKDVKAGDMLCFPTGEKGAHVLANASDTEKLVYIDFAANPKKDICILPDTNKAVIIGEHVPFVFLDMPKK